MWGRSCTSGLAHCPDPDRGRRPIATLTSRQRAHLRTLAHSLKPILQVGADGVGDTFTRALDEAFNTRELLKIRVLEGAPEDTRATAAELEARLPGVQVAQVIGRTIVVYRPFPDEPDIRLPG